jgi:hypothetical protein
MDTPREMEKANGGRCCQNCACVYLAPVQQVQTAAALEANPQLADPRIKEVWVCRLNPPVVVRTPQGPVMLQAPTEPWMVCWNWRDRMSSLPGDPLERAREGAAGPQVLA